MTDRCTYEAYTTEPDETRRCKLSKGHKGTHWLEGVSHPCIGRDWRKKLEVQNAPRRSGMQKRRRASVQRDGLEEALAIVPSVC